MANIFKKAIENFAPYKDMLDSLERGQTPVSVSGVSAVHKAHFALGLRKKSPVLMICDSEASASKLAEDINALSGDLRLSVSRKGLLLYARRDRFP